RLCAWLGFVWPLRASTSTQPTPDALAWSVDVCEPVIQEIQRDRDQGCEEGEKSPGGGVAAAVFVGVAKDQHRQPRREHNGDQEVENVRLGRALKGEHHLGPRASP